MNNQYSILIQWSDQDRAFLVHLPDFPSQHFVTHGDTYEEALTNGLEVIEILKESYLEDGITLPILKLREL
ncbi:MAG: type II toxin-antitoxin system HicB family antitoxin [Cyanobacteria bacterium]|nr:type II toxin-antitoxin system HicB family antitoxin [Cyanobacteriota bacterium]